MKSQSTSSNSPFTILSWNMEGFYDACVKGGVIIVTSKSPLRCIIRVCAQLFSITFWPNLFTSALGSVKEGTGSASVCLWCSPITRGQIFWKNAAGERCTQNEHRSAHIHSPWSRADRHQEEPCPNCRPLKSMTSVLFIGHIIGHAYVRCMLAGLENMESSSKANNEIISSTTSERVTVGSLATNTSLQNMRFQWIFRGV